MALGLSLSTLGNLGRVASRGVEQHAQRRQEDADRELAKDMLTASVKGDYDELAGKLQQGFYGDVRPELLDAASQTVSQGLRLKREEEYTKRQKMYEIEGIELAKIQENTAQYGYFSPQQQREEAKKRARMIVQGRDPGAGPPAAGGGPPAAGRPATGGGRIGGTGAIAAMVKKIEGIEDEEERIEQAKEDIKRLKDAYQTGRLHGMTPAQYENALSRIENAATPWIGFGRGISSALDYGKAALVGGAAGARLGPYGALGGAALGVGARAGLPDFDWSNLGNIKKGFLGEGIGR